MQLSVVLGSSTPEESFSINLYDNPFVQKWIKELRWCLDNCEFNQQEIFSRFLSAEDRATLLTNSIVTINNYVKNFIELRHNILKQDQEYFNYLHLKFEQLVGQFDKPTRLWTIANNELKDAIRTLNYMIHCIEGNHKNQRYPSVHISFNKNQIRRQPLLPEDYQYFKLQADPGELTIHYIEIGKDFQDLYEDDLELDYAGFKNLHYYSGETTLWLKSWNYFEDPGFLKWFEKNNIDPYDKTLGHGQIPLGIVDDVEGVKNKLIKHPCINKIIIHE